MFTAHFFQDLVLRLPPPTFCNGKSVLNVQKSMVKKWKEEGIFGKIAHTWF
jgi:hypothetical protein